MQKQISIIEPSNINAIEREFFHLIGNHLKKDRLASVDLTNLTGSLEIYSLMSWANILKIAIQEEKVEKDKETYQFILDRITEAYPLATKLSFIISYIEHKKMKLDFPDKAYHEAIVGLFADQDLQLKLPKIDKRAFLNKYTLDNIEAIPVKLVETRL